MRKDEALAILAELYKADDLDPDEFTTREFADRMGISRHAAFSRLGVLLAHARVARRDVVTSSRRVVAWKLVESKSINRGVKK